MVEAWAPWMDSAGVLALAVTVWAWTAARRRMGR